MKRIILISAILLHLFLLSAQKTVLKKAYYDYWETTIQREWHELGDGTKDGLETFYYESGEIAYTINYHKGISLETKSFFEDGSPIMEVRQNEEGKYDGLQKYYQFTQGTHSLKAEARAENGTIRTFKSYKSDGSPEWSYEYDGVTKKYIEYKDREIETELAITDRLLTGHIKDRAFFENNKVIGLNESTVQAEKDGDLLHVQNADYGTDSYRKKIYHNPIDFMEEFLTAHPLMGQMFELKLKVVNYKGSEIIDNSHSYQYSHYYAKLNDQNKVTNYLLNQYVWDGRAEKKKGDVLIAEYFYDEGDLVWSKEFEGPDGSMSYEFKDNTEFWYDKGQLTKVQRSNGEYLTLIKLYQDGVLVSCDSLIDKITIDGKEFSEVSEICNYNQTGSLISRKLSKGNDLLSYWNYDEKGTLIDSKELRNKISSFIDLKQKSELEAENLKWAIISQMESEFCLLQKDYTAYEVSNCEATPKHIYSALKVIYQDYLTSLKQIEETLSGQYGYNASKSIPLERADKLVVFYEENYNILKQKEELGNGYAENLIAFNKVIESQEELKELNKKLKNVDDPEEIRTIIASI